MLFTKENLSPKFRSNRKKIKLFYIGEMTVPPHAVCAALTKNTKRVAASLRGKMSQAFWWN